MTTMTRELAMIHNSMHNISTNIQRSICNTLPVWFILHHTDINFFTKLLSIWSA